MPIARRHIPSLGPAFARLLPLVLVAAMLLGAVHVGAMRGLAPAAGSIILCTGGQALRVAVDAKGQPVAPAPLCPDCTISLAEDPRAPATPLRAEGLPKRSVWADRSASPKALHGVVPSARGPPIPV